MPSGAKQTDMKIAVTSQNFKRLTEHAGKSRRFIVFDAATASAPSAQRGVKVVICGGSDPHKAVRDHLNGAIKSM